MSAFLRKYNTLLVTGTTAIRIPIIKRGAVDFAVGADWTPAAGDVKIAIDGAAAANVTNLPTAIAMGNTAYWEFILTAAELSCKQAIITVADSATKAVEDQAFIVETFGHASAMYAADWSLANLPANVTQLLGTAWLTPATAGTPDVNAKLVGATVQTGFDLASRLDVAVSTRLAGASYTTPLDAAGTRTAVGLATANLDTQLSGINSKTTNLPSDPADQSLIIAATNSLASVLGTPVGASLAADIAAAKSDTAAIKLKTDNLPASPAAVGSAMTLTSGERDSIAAAVGARQITEGYAADGTAPTLDQALSMIFSVVAQYDIVSTTLTARKLDGTTAAMTFTLNDATNPTSRTRTA